MNGTNGSTGRPTPRAGGLEIPATLRLPGGPLGIVLRGSPRARRLRVVVDHRRGVVVTVPVGRAGRLDEGRAIREAERFLGEREAWVRRHAQRLAAAGDRATGSADLAEGATIRYRGEPHTLRILAAGPGARRSTVTREGAEAGDELVVRVAPRDPRPLDAVLRDWFVERARIAIAAAIRRHAPALGVEPAAVAVRDSRTRWGSASRKGRLSFSWRLILAPDEALETVAVHELAHLRVFGHGPAFWALVAGRRPDHADWRRWLRRHAPELHATLD